MAKLVLDKWVEDILRDPITKEKKPISEFKKVDGIIDARIYLKNTYGFKEWTEGQTEFERWETSSTYYKSKVENYKKEINRDRSIYDHFKLKGDILDVGGLTGTTREFLNKDSRYISIDPYINCLKEIPEPRRKAYKCLSQKLNFIGAMAEFLPFKEQSFDCVHMRSMIDHVQIPDLALKEAKRVLKKEGFVLIGIFVEGGKYEKISTLDFFKENIKSMLVKIGFQKFKDHHIFHPTLSNLKKLIKDNGFTISDYFWQPEWNDQVVYIKANKEMVGEIYI
tara:strand:- start:20496 stop:21335 length:840 start_codon:yes stop_codon:yes gene_type:complete